MHCLKSFLWWMSLVVICVEITTARKKNGGISKHTYPTGGLSGGGSHSYGGLSGGNNHGYPGANSHNYPNYNMNGNSHSNAHSYPIGGGLSGNTPSHGYAGGNKQNYHPSYTQAHYQPPPQIHYTPVGGGPPQAFHTYQGALPTYVTNPQKSYGKYSNLVTGLALFSLGTAVGAGVGHYASNSGHREYHPVAGEKCVLSITKPNGDFEKTDFDCKLISDLIFTEEAKKEAGEPSSVTTVTNTTVTNTTNSIEGANASNSTNSTNTDSSITSTTTTTSVITTVPPKTKCTITRFKGEHAVMRKEIECGVLLTYHQASFKGSQSALISSMILTFTSAIFAIIFVN